MDGLLRNLDRDAQEGLGQPPVNYSTDPLGFDPTLLSTGCGYPRDDFASDIAGDDAYTPHVAEGIDAEAHNEYLCMREGMYDLVESQTAIIHGIAMLPPDIAEMAARGASLIWSPRTNISLYGDTARVTEYARLGVPIALGTDWPLSGSMNMLRELKCADELNFTYFGGFFSDEQLWLMATREAAAALAVDDVVGVLAPGQVADIAIFATRGSRPDHRAVIEAQPEDVVLVLRGGTVLYGDADIVGALETGCDTLDVCGTQKSACVMREIGMSLSALQTANSSHYPLFFCDDPTGEPTCIPRRDASPPLPSPIVDGSNAYSGNPTTDDADGDGIPNAMDDCASVFNPIRPLDEGVQADFDGDGIGDACDPCPLDPGVSACSAPDPNDRDNDGIDNATDNCPDVANAGQEDRDADGKGDICDPCPDEPNPGSAACPATVYDLRMGVIPEGTYVSLSGLVVTAVGGNGFYAQQAMGTTDYAGVDFSGIFVFTGTTPAVARGDVIDVSNALAQNRFEQYQLSSVTFAVTASGMERAARRRYGVDRDGGHARRGARERARPRHRGHGDRRQSRRAERLRRIRRRRRPPRRRLLLRNDAAPGGRRAVRSDHRTARLHVQRHQDPAPRDLGRRPVEPTDRADVRARGAFVDGDVHRRHPDGGARRRRERRDRDRPGRPRQRAGDDRGPRGIVRGERQLHRLRDRRHRHGHRELRGRHGALERRREHPARRPHQRVPRRSEQRQGDRALRTERDRSVDVHPPALLERRHDAHQHRPHGDARRRRDPRDLPFEHLGHDALRRDELSDQPQRRRRLRRHL